MSTQRIATRYAKSLIDLAVDQDKLQQIFDDVNGFLKICDNREFYLLLKSPIVNSDKKKNIFNSILKDKVDPLMFDFLSIILRKGREEFLPEIAESFIEQYKEMKEITTVTLTTASEISEAKLNEIKERIKQSGQTYANIDLQHKIDPSIIGGLIIEFGDRLYDASILHKLNQMRKTLAGA